MKNMTILSIDYGEKKLGLALKKKGSLDSKPYGNFKNQGDLLLKITNFCKQKKVDMILIGYPFGSHFKKTRITFLVEHFAKIVRQSIPKKMQLKLINERFTTTMAKRKFYYENKHSSETAWKKAKDSLSADFILKRYLEFYFKDNADEI